MLNDYRECHRKLSLSCVTITFFDAIEERHQTIHKVEILIEKLHLIKVCIIRDTKDGRHQRSNIKSYALSFYSRFKCKSIVGVL